MEKPRKSYRLWILGHVLRALLGAALLALFLFLFWRVFLSDRLSASMKRLSPNETLAEAYLREGDLTMFTQDQASITKVADYNYGYFGVPRFVLIEEASQAQVVFRYNNSTLKKVARDMGLPEPLPRGEEVFDITLVVVRGREEKATFTRVAPTSVQMETTKLYTYFLYTFDGIPFSEHQITLIDLDVYYPAGAADYETDARGTLRLYDCDQPRIAVSLSAADKKALEAYGQ